MKNSNQLHYSTIINDWILWSCTYTIILFLMITSDCRVKLEVKGLVVTKDHSVQLVRKEVLVHLEMPDPKDQRYNDQLVTILQVYTFFIGTFRTQRIRWTSWTNWTKRELHRYTYLHAYYCFYCRVLMVVLVTLVTLVLMEIL